MFGLKMGELLIIFLVILVLFGGTKLPQLGSSLGQAIRNFKKGFGGDAEAQAEAHRQDALNTGCSDATKTRSPRSRLGQQGRLRPARPRRGPPSILTLSCSGAAGRDLPRMTPWREAPSGRVPLRHSVTFSPS